MIYSLSGCMGNLGVVPLFLLCFFLVRPCFFFLFLLLIFVTLVRETIMRPLLKLKLEFPLLLHIALFVKAVGPFSASKSFAKTYILGLGEQITISEEKPSQISIGNPSILTQRYTKKGLYIKGKKMGYSDLIIWTRTGKIQHHFYILSKRNNLKLVHLKKFFSYLGLKVRLIGPLLQVSGEIKKLSHYLFLKNKNKIFNENIIYQLTLSENLKKELLGKIYYYLWQDNQNYFKCHSDYLEISCFVEELTPNIISLQKKYALTLYPHDKNQHVLYNIKINLYSRDSENAIDLSLKNLSLLKNTSHFLTTLQILTSNNSLSSVNINSDLLLKLKILKKKNTLSLSYDLSGSSKKSSIISLLENKETILFNLNSKEKFYGGLINLNFAQIFSESYKKQIIATVEVKNVSN